MTVSKKWSYFLFVLALICAGLSAWLFVRGFLFDLPEGLPEGLPEFITIMRLVLAAAAFIFLIVGIVVNRVIHAINDCLKLQNSQVSFLMSKFKL